MMRKVEIGTSRFTEVFCVDAPGAGGASHEYEVRRKPPGGATISETGIYAGVKFQKGPIQENGVNGCHQEDLLAIVLDRLYSFQAGDYRCRENALAITKIEEALMWLNKRTADRQKRGVEGAPEK